MALGVTKPGRVLINLPFLTTTCHMLLHHTYELHCIVSPAGKKIRPVYGTASSVWYTGRGFLSRRRDGQIAPYDGKVTVFLVRSAVVRCTYTCQGEKLRVSICFRYPVVGGKLFRNLRSVVVSLLTGKNRPHRHANRMFTGPIQWSLLYTAWTPRYVGRTRTCECLAR